MIVSVIIPTYNSTDTINECIASIKNQNYNNDYEIIVVDNGSDDDTVNKLKLMGIEKIIISPYTTVYGSRNMAINQSRGDIIALLDSDCVACTGWLSAGVKKLKHSDIIAGKIIPKKTKKTILYYYDKYILWQEPERDINNVNIAAGNAFIKREVFESLNGFRDDIVTAGDSIFSMMARKKGYKIAYSENAIVSHPVDPIGKKLRGIFREGAGAQIKSPYKYEKDKTKKKINKRFIQMIRQYKDDLISIYKGWKKREIKTIKTVQLVILAICMRTLMYFSIILSIYFKPVSKMLSRR